MHRKMVGKNKNIIQRRYPEEKYSILFNKKTGYFVRIEDKGEPEPLWSKHGPELLDISITNWCDQGCSFCYRQSTVQGDHMKLSDYRKIMKQAQELEVLQIALGGGNPNQHPEFVEILKCTHEHGIVPCYTTNGRGLSEEILKATKEYCGSVAISIYEPYSEFKPKVDKFIEYDIKVNVHFVLDSKSINTAIAWLKNVPEFLNGINSIIFLNYKPIGRKPNRSLLLKDQEKISEFFELVENKKLPFKVGFDSCSISGVARYLKSNSRLYEGCDAGRFSAFIDENLRMFPCSFMTNTNWYGDLNSISMFEIWSKNQYFVKYRNKIIHNGCNSCTLQSTCMGGCPFIDELSLCGWKDERLQMENKLVS